MYHYEGQDIDTYKIPTPYVDVITIRQSATRGIAFAVEWRKLEGHQLWITSLHDYWIDWYEK